MKLPISRDETFYESFVACDFYDCICILWNQSSYFYLSLCFQFLLEICWLNSLMLFFDFSIHGVLPNSCSISIHNGFIHLMVTLPLRSRVAREWRNCSKVTREAKEGGAPAAESSGQTKIQRQNPICAAQGKRAVIKRMETSLVVLYRYHGSRR